ncbi:hypothetical protein KBC59_03565 [Patescibacteria group bacterium]|jgi:hypothetical protein|nr:hypothetical protein [Patescibacteria group bacterium]
MSEHFSSFESAPKPASPETEKILESIEEVRGIWIENVQRFDELIPSNDIIVDEKTIAVGVVRSALLANLIEIDEIEQEVRKAA